MGARGNKLPDYVWLRLTRAAMISLRLSQFPLSRNVTNFCVCPVWCGALIHLAAGFFTSHWTLITQMQKFVARRGPRWIYIHCGDAFMRISRAINLINRVSTASVAALGVRNSLFRCDHTRRQGDLTPFLEAARALSKYNWICTAGIFIASAVYSDRALFWLDCVLLRPAAMKYLLSSVGGHRGMWDAVRVIWSNILLGRFYDTKHAVSMQMSWLENSLN
jgi:hypothetical protein